MKFKNDITIVNTQYGAVLFDEGRGKYWCVNRTGSRILDALADDPSVEAAIEKVAQHYAVDPETIRRDMTTLTNRLASAGLLK